MSVHVPDTTTKPFADYLSSSLVRYKGVSLSFLTTLRDDILAGRQAPETELYVLLEDEQGVSAGRTVKSDGLASIGTFNATVPPNIQKQEWQESKLSGVRWSKAQLKPRESWTVEDVSNFVVLPATSRAGQTFFLDCLPNDTVGNPFQGSIVRQPSNTRFTSLVESLELHFKGTDPSEAYVWVDLLCSKSSQYRSEDQEDFIQDDVKDAMARFSHRLVLWNGEKEESRFPFQKTEFFTLLSQVLDCRKPFDIIHDSSIKDEEMYENQLIAAALSLESLQREGFGKSFRNIPGGFQMHRDGFVDRLRLATVRSVREAVELERFNKDKTLRTADFFNQAGKLLLSLQSLSLAKTYIVRAKNIYVKVHKGEHKDVALSMLHLAWIYFEAKQDQVALGLCNKALEIYRETVGKFHAGTAEAYKLAGSIHAIMQDFDQALRMYNCALEISKSLKGENDVSLADIYQDIADIYCRQKRTELELEFRVKALQVMKNLMGEKHPCVAMVHESIGAVYAATGAHDKAREMFVKGLETKKNALGENHLDVAASYSTLANYHMHENSFELALKYLQKAQQITSDNFGEFHCATADTFRETADLYRVQKMFDLAQEHYQKALKVYEGMLGNHDSVVVATSTSIGVLYSRQEEYTKARDLFSDLSEKVSKAVGSNHPLIADIHMALGSVLTECGTFTTGLEFLQKAEEIYREQFGVRHIKLARVLARKGMLYQEMCQSEKSIKALEEALKIAQENSSDSDIPFICFELGVAYESVGKFELAFEILAKASIPKIARAMDNIYSFGRRRTDVHHVVILLRVGEKLSLRGMEALALKVFKKTLEICKLSLGTFNHHTAVTYLRLSQLYYQNRMVEPSIQVLKKSIKIVEVVSEKNHIHTGESYHFLGKMYQEQNKFALALEAFKQAHSIYSANDNVDSDTLGQMLLNMAEIHLKFGHLDEADAAGTAAMECLIKAKGEDHERLAEVYNVLGSTYRRKGRLQPALDMLKKALRRKKEVSGNNESGLVHIYNNIGDVYSDYGSYNLAIKLYLKTLKILKKTCGEPGLRLVGDLYAKLAVEYSKLGNLKKAIELSESAVEVKEKVGAETSDILDFLEAARKVQSHVRESHW